MVHAACFQGSTQVYKPMPFIHRNSLLSVPDVSKYKSALPWSYNNPSSCFRSMNALINLFAC